MDRESKDAKLDKLLEEEMIKEAELIEKSLLGNEEDDIPISEADIDKSYERFLKRLKAEGIYSDEQEESRQNHERISALKSAEKFDPESQGAQIVQFPGMRGRNSEEESEKAGGKKEKDSISVVSFVQKNIPEDESDDALEKEEEKLSVEELRQIFYDSFGEERKPEKNMAKAAGFAVLLALGILAGSLASQADTAKFVSTIESIVK